MVSEKIKTWYFPYSAFWLTGQWGKGYSPPPLATLLNGTLFSTNSGGDLRSGTHQSQIIGGDADVDHTQIIGGIYPPQVSAPLSMTDHHMLSTTVLIAYYFSSTGDFQFWHFPTTHSKIPLSHYCT